MSERRLRRALTGLAAGVLLTAILLGVSAVGARFGAPSIPYSLFEWLTRVLPGRLVIFGLETTVHVLEGLGLNIKNTAKTTEEVLALTGLLVAGAVTGLLFFSFVAATDRRRVRRYGLALGALLGVFCLVIALIESPAATLGGDIAGGVWIVGVLLLWGWALARMFLVVAAPAVAEPPATAPAAPPSSTLPPVAPSPEAWAAAATIDRRHFMIRVGGAVATFVVLGAELSDILRVESGAGVVRPVKAPIAFPNADSPVRPVPGTRLEYTPVADHYRVDIDLSAAADRPASWRLQDQRAGRPTALAHPGPAQDRLPIQRPVHHPLLHLEPGRRAADRDHPVDRPAVPRRAGRARGRSRRRATRTCSRRTASTRSSICG